MVPFASLTWLTASSHAPPTASPLPSSDPNSVSTAPIPCRGWRKRAGPLHYRAPYPFENLVQKQKLSHALSQPALCARSQTAPCSKVTSMWATTMVRMPNSKPLPNSPANLGLSFRTQGSDHQHVPPQWTSVKNQFFAASAARETSAESLVIPRLQQTRCSRRACACTALPAVRLMPLAWFLRRLKSFYFDTL